MFFNFVIKIFDLENVNHELINQNSHLIVCKNVGIIFRLTKSEFSIQISMNHSANCLILFLYLFLLISLNLYAHVFIWVDRIKKNI